MSNQVLDGAQRIKFGGRVFNVNTKMSLYEINNSSALSYIFKYKALPLSILRKKLRSDEYNKNNKYCYIASNNDKNAFSCSTVKLIDNDPEIISDKLIPSLALFLADKYPVEDDKTVNFYIYTFKDRPNIRESIQEYYGVIGINTFQLLDAIYESLEALEAAIDLYVDVYGLENFSVSKLEIDGRTPNTFMGFTTQFLHKYPVLKNQLHTIEDLLEGYDDFTQFCPADIRGGFSPKQMVSTIILGGMLYGVNYYIDNYKDEKHQSVVSCISVIDQETQEEIPAGSCEVLLPVLEKETYLSEFKQREAKDGAEKRLIYEQGKSEFISEYYSNLYSTAEIHENFNVIRALFPDYLAEWQLSKIVFDSRNSLKSNQMFFVVYDRIKGSIGVYDELDRRIEAISREKGIHIEAKELIKNEDKATGFQGESRVYMIDFGYEHKLELYKKSLVSMDFLAERDKKVVELSIQANQTKANIYSLISDATKIKKEELIFGHQHLLIENAINYQVSVLSKMYDDIINLTKVPVKTMPIPENTNFDEYKYISLKQRDSLFEWSYPSLKNIYPNPKKIKKDKLSVFAKEFSFNLKSDKKVSLGYTYYLEAIERLNIDQIQIRFATYDVKEQSYLIEGRFFEQIDLIP